MGGITLILIIKLVLSFWKKEKNSKKLFHHYGLALILLLSVSVLSGIFLGPYYDNYQDTGDPLAINIPKSPPPHLFQKTYLPHKSGVTSLANSFLTFHPVLLFKYPFMDRSDKIRISTIPNTSLWTQLYARANFIQYEAHPKQWKNKTKTAFYTARLSYALALIPLSFFLYGLFLNIYSLYLGIKKRGLLFLLNTSEWIFLFLTILFIAVLIKFCVDYRKVGSMKIIYILPVLLGFTKIFSDGFLKIQKKINNLKYHYLYNTIFYLLITLLISLYVFDSILLFETLQRLVKI